VEHAHAIDLLTAVAGKNAHAEFFVGIAFVFAAHIHKSGPTDAQFLGEAAHVFKHKVFVEFIVAGGNRGMYRVERRGAYYFEGFAKVKSFLSNQVDHTLGVDQGGVAFVAMIYLFFDTQDIEQLYAANAQQVFLFQAIFPVAAVELGSNLTLKLAVARMVGIYQVEIHSAHGCFPNIAIHYIARKVHFQHQGIALFVFDLFYGQCIEVLRFIDGNLLTFHRKSLSKITVAVEKTHGCHGNIAVGSFFQVIAGQYAQAA